MSLRELIIEELKAAKPEGNMSSDDWIEWLYSLSEGIAVKHVDSQEVKERHWIELLTMLGRVRCGERIDLVPTWKLRETGYWDCACDEGFEAASEGFEGLFGFVQMMIESGSCVDAEDNP